MSTPKRNSTKKTTPLIYCGPTIRKVDLRNNQVFNAGIPKVYEDVMEECTAVRSLFVPVTELNNVQVALRNSGSLESILYKNVQKYLNGGDM